MPEWGWPERHDRAPGPEARRSGIRERRLVEWRAARLLQVQLTRTGRALQGRLLKVVITFNQQLRTGIVSDDIETLRRVLGQLQQNVA